LYEGDQRIGGVNLKLVMDEPIKLNMAQPVKLVPGYNNVYDLYRNDNKKVGEVGLKSSTECLYIYNFIIMPEHRQKGFGKLMIAEIAKLAKQKNCNKLKLMVEERNLPAVRLYEKTGFVFVGHKEKLRVYERKL
jgi:ribosomal protein S18 acetylase RimI-like enzyme